MITYLGVVGTMCYWDLIYTHLSLSLLLCNFFPIGLTRTRCGAAISTSYIAIFSRFHLLNYYVILPIKQDQLQQQQEEDMLVGLAVCSLAYVPNISWLLVLSICGFSNSEEIPSQHYYRGES